MKRSIKIKTVILAVLIGLANYMGGCSVVGLGVGAAIDNSIDDKKSLTNWECGKIKEGTETTVHLSDGSAISGKFGGLEKKKTEEYIKEYAEFRKTYENEVYLPGIGDTIRINYRYDEKGIHEFLGFDLPAKRSGRYAKRRSYAPYINVTANKLNENVEKNYSLKYLEEIEDSKGNRVTDQDLEGFTAKSKFPTRSCIILSTDSTHHQVNVEKINFIEARRIKYAKWIGLGLGVAIDAAIITVIVILSTMEPVSLDGLRFAD
jgi:hypothetical protein